MSGVALKITTLLIRTVSKPIANNIKAQAKEHEGFRRICVGWAQFLHRIDMRLRLGLLQDPAALERQAAREAADAAKKKRLAEAPTVKTEAQARADEEAAKQAAKEGVKELKKKDERKKIKPLSEAKAIDLGANFIAEGFLFCVAVGTVLFETYRSRKKEKNRRDDVADQLAELKDRDEVKTVRIEELEREVRELRSHEWHWPWQQQRGPVDDEESQRHSRVLAQVAEREKEREREREQAKLAANPETTLRNAKGQAEIRSRQMEQPSAETASDPLGTSQPTKPGFPTARPANKDATSTTSNPIDAGSPPKASNQTSSEQK